MIDRLAEACADFAVRRRWPILIVTFLLVAAAAYPAVFIDHDAAYEIWFLEDDPALVAYQEFHELFGNDEFLLVVHEAESGTVFTNEILGSLDRLAGFLETAPYVQAVVNLARFEAIRGAEDALDLEQVVPRLPMTDAELSHARHWVLDDPLAVSSVVSRDGRTAITIVELEQVPGEYLHRIELVEAIEAHLEDERARSGLVFHLVGGAVMDRDVLEVTKRDFWRNVPMVAGFILIFLLFTIRSVTGTILPVLTVLGAIVVARISIPLLGWKDNNMLMIVPLVVLAIGVADSVHIVVHYLRLRGQGADGPDAARETVRRLFKPCLLTTFTTAVGFLALQSAALAPLRQLGLITGIGVIAAFFFSVLPLPAALSLMRGDSHRRHARLEAGVISRLVAVLPDFVESHRVTVFVVGILLSIAGVAGAVQLQVESNAIELFKEDDPFRIFATRLEKSAGGIGSLEVIVDTGRPGGVRRPEVLAAMADFQVFLERQPLVTGSHSVVDYLKTINRAMHNDDPAAYRLPESSDLTAQYLLLYDASSPTRGLDNLVDLTHTRARLWARTRFGSSGEYRELQAAAEAFAAERFPEDTTLKYTGIVTLYKNMGDYIVLSQTRSFIFALIVITITMMIAFRSIRMGLLSLIPNVWPILLTIGYMGWRGIWLEPSTAMVAAVSIGIAVDDSVHFLSNYQEAIRSGASSQEAVRFAFNIAGRAIMFTTVILIAGFGAITMSEFKPYINFGFLCGMAVLLALIGDLFILPAVFFGYRPIGRKRSRKAAARVTGLVLTALAGLSATAPAALAQAPVRAESPSIDNEMTPSERRGRAIMDRLEAHGQTVDAEWTEVTMVLGDKKGRSIERRAELAILDGKDGGRSLIRFTDPPDLRGTAFLTREREGDDDQWLYLPGLGKVKRIAASKKAGSFAGTEFTYEDLGGREVEEYRYDWIGEEIAGADTLDVIESTPLDANSGYSKVIIRVSRNKLALVAVEYFDRKERLLKRSVAGEFVEIAPGQWRADILTMENVQNGKSTMLRVDQRVMNAELEEAQFTVEALKGEW